MSISNSELAHQWVYDTPDGEGRGSNMFYEGDSIYSYGHHFKIAQKYHGVVLYNEDTYSPTTSKHQCYVRGAVYQELVYCAALSGYTPGTYTFFNANMKEWLKQIEHIVRYKLSKARKPEKYLNEIAEIVRRAERLCQVLGEKLPKYLEDFKDVTNSSEMIEKMKVAAKKQMEAEERRRKKVEKEAIKNFMEFKTSYCDTKYQLVRYNKEKNRFETSKHVEIPFEKGREFYERLRDGLLKVGDKLLFYTVSEVGNLVRVGCHTFEKKYLLDFGAKMFA